MIQEVKSCVEEGRGGKARGSGTVFVSRFIVVVGRFDDVTRSRNDFLPYYIYISYTLCTIDSFDVKDRRECCRYPHGEDQATIHFSIEMSCRDQSTFAKKVKG